MIERTGRRGRTTPFGKDIRKFKPPVARTAAVLTSTALLSVLPAAAAPAQASTQHSPAVTASWGYNVLVWRYSVTDPGAFYRQYYYSKCKDEQ